MGGFEATLSGGRCKPGGALPGAEELARLRAQLPDWRVAEDRLLPKTFLFPDFRPALKCTNPAGAVAEEENHHAEVPWRRADVKTRTRAGGLAGKDLHLTATADQAHFGR
jgi:pterin-4a-carbinolamine dehydratase